MTREEAKMILEEVKIMDDSMYQYNTKYLEALDMAIDALKFDIDQYCKEHFCVMVDKDVWEKAEKAMKQEPCEDAISREYLVEHIKACWTNGRPKYSPDLSELLSWINDVPPVIPQMKDEDIAKAFQFGMALGFGEKHDEMDKVIDEIKKVITPQPKTKRCKECKYSEYCKRWGNKYKTKEDDYCFMFEPQERSDKE